MKRQPPRAGRKPSIVLPLVLLLGALALSTPAAWNALHFWSHVPPVRQLPLFRTLLTRGETDDLRTAFDRINRSMPPDARAAFALRRASMALGQALAGTGESDQLQTTVATAVSPASASQLGRLQRAAARMWLLEQAGTPAAEWWPALRVFLEGARGADFSHYQAALTRCWARAYELAGWGPGSAYGLAETLIGQPHGPFLQFFAQRLQRVIREREQAGDAVAAETCRDVLHALLKQWVLEPGPEGLRLLAADLLAESLETDAVLENTPEAQAVARGLRAWRAACHQAIGQHPTAILAPDLKPAVAPLEHNRLLTRVALTTWLGSAVLAAALVAIVLGWAWLGRRRGAVRGRNLVLHSIIAGLVVTAAGLAWIHFWPNSVPTDLRGDFSDFHHWWRHPFVAAGLTLALTFAAALLQRPPSSGKSPLLPRLGMLAAGVWLVLAVALWCSVGAGGLARREYERAARTARADVIAATTGPETEGWLSVVRQWTP